MLPRPGSGKPISQQKAQKMPENEWMNARAGSFKHICPMSISHAQIKQTMQMPFVVFVTNTI